MDKDNLTLKKDDNYLKSLYKSYTILVKEYHKSLLAYAICLSKDYEPARDLCQDTFVTAFEKFEDFNTDQDFGAWIRGILRNKYRNHIRKKSKDFIILEADVLDAIDFEHLKWESTKIKSGVNIFSILKQCLHKLPKKMSQAVDSFYFQDLDGKETSEKLQMKEPALRKCLQRARTALRSCIESKQESLA